MKQAQSADARDQTTSREREIEMIVKSEYRRLQFGKKDVYLRSPERIMKMGEAGHASLLHDPQYELKKDIASALGQYTPVEHHIIFSVLIQGQSVEAVIRHLKFSHNAKRRNWSSRRWQAWLYEQVMPALRTKLADYFVKGKVIAN